MRKLPLLLLGIAVTACHHSKDSIEKELSSQPPLEIMKQLQVADIFGELKPLLIDAPEVFIVPSKTIQTIEGKKGLRILVDAANLETVDGKLVTGDVIVNMKEMLNAADMIANNCPTVSNGKMLVSDGSYYVGMTCNGKELRVKKGRFVQVEFPRSGKTSMELFTGQRDASGMMNWVPINQKLQSAKPVVAKTASAQTQLVQVPPSNISRDQEIRNRIQNEYAKAVTKKTRMPYKVSLQWLKEYHDSIITARREAINCAYPLPKSSQIQEIVNEPVKISLQAMPYLTMPLTNINKTTYIHCTLNSIHYFVYGYRDSVEYFSKVANFKDSAITYGSGISADEQTDATQSRGTYYTSNYNTPDYTVNTVKDGSGKTKKEVTYYAPAEIENLGWINCDHFYDAPDGITPQYTLNIEGDVPDNIGVYIIFRDINAMLSEGAYTFGKKSIILKNNLPVNSKVEFVFYSKANNQFLQCKETALVTKDMIVPVKFSPVPDGQIKKFFMD